MPYNGNQIMVRIYVCHNIHIRPVLTLEYFSTITILIKKKTLYGRVITLLNIKIRIVYKIHKMA